MHALAYATTACADLDQTLDSHSPAAERWTISGTAATYLYASFKSRSKVALGLFSDSGYLRIESTLMASYTPVNPSSGDDSSNTTAHIYEQSGHLPSSYNPSSETELDSRYDPQEGGQRQARNQRRDAQAQSKTPAHVQYEDYQPSSRRNKNGFAARLFYWKWEFVSCWVVLILIFVILATLYPHEGKPQPRWPYHISINALLSVYSAILQAALTRERPLLDLVRYDSAGRGPLGSARWLWTNHIRHPLTAFGAIITIAALAMDPFIQQLVTYDGCSIALDDKAASLPRTNYFINLGVHIGAGLNSVTPQFQSAINSGIFSTAKQPISFDCSTGNCTFPETFATVGYCSKCQDVSGSVQFSQSCYLSTNNTTKPVSCSAKVEGFFYQNSTASIPGGIYVNTTSGTGLPTVAAMGVTDSGEIQFIANNVSFVETGVTIGGENKTDLGCDNLSHNNTWPCRGWGAASCTLEPCVRVYQSTINAGVLSETVLEDSSGIEWGIDRPNSTINNLPVMGMVDTRCISPQERDGLVKQGYKINPATRWLAYNTTTEISLTMPSNASFPESLSAHQCLYNVDYSTNSDLFVNYLNTFFTGTIKGEWVEGGCCAGFEGSQDLLSLYNFSSVSFADFQRAFGDIADSMTKFVRENGQPDRSVYATGQVQHYATCVDVRWSWISLPAALVAMTLLFFYPHSHHQ
ncbi:hypothetical protein F5884DRAFT_838164 [Xylogone sp. PMI_703]|nr:hypothetical protein F5884DRAFT_838164 [Xylogone sp. PMI_703]